LDAPGGKRRPAHGNTKYKLGSADFKQPTMILEKKRNEKKDYYPKANPATAHS